MNNQPNINRSEQQASLIAGIGLALAGTGLLLRGKVGPALGAFAVGGALLYRGKTSHCPLYEALDVDTSEQTGESALPEAAPTQPAKQLAAPKIDKVELVETVTVNKPASELYEFWSDTANFATVMPQIQSVQKNGNHLKWMAQLPAGQTLHWESEIVEEKPGELLRWETTGADGVAGMALPHSGSLSLLELAHDRGTKVTLKIAYDPQAGAVGALLAKFFGVVPQQFLTESLRRFKQLQEAGEIAIAQNQPV